MTAFILTIYGLVLFVSLMNLILTRRLSREGGDVGDVAFLIPARNESHQIGALVESLVSAGAKVYVYDDASEDGTAEVASSAGATVLRGQGPPDGWTGKNNACFQLAKVVAEDFSGTWIVFVDADLTFKQGSVERIASTLRFLKPNVPAWTAFPRMRYANPIEAIYTCWVPYTLLALNPFFLNRLGVHNRFTNGQLTAWRTDAYWEISPHEKVKGEVLEDVLIGRLLAREGRRIAVGVAADAVEVRMYSSLKEAFRGMLKNSGQIAGYGSIPFAAFLIALATMWLALGSVWIYGLAMLGASMLFTLLVVRGPVALALTAPLSLAAAGFTVIASTVARRKGVDWKGRVYRG